MQVTPLSGCRPRTVPFKADVVISVVDSHNRYAEGLVSCSPELGHLISKVVDHPVDLLNHCLGQNFNLHSNFECRNSATRDCISLVSNRFFAWNDFAESAVAASRSNSLESIGDVQDQNTPINSRAKLGGSLNRYKVLE